MQIQIEAEVSVKSGLKLIARAEFVRCHYSDYPGCDYLDDVALFWHSGHEYKLKVSDADMRSVTDTLFDCARELRSGPGPGSRRGGY